MNVSLATVNRYNDEHQEGKYPCLAIERRIHVSRTGRKTYRTVYKRHCKLHGNFEQDHGHGYKLGCPLCEDETRRFTLDEVREAAQKVHGDKYIYWRVFTAKSTHNRIYTYAEIICRNHGIFVQRVGLHLRGNGCPNCSSSVSKIEQEWLRSLKNSRIRSQYTLQANGRTYVVDGFDVEANTVYEMNGDFFHGNPAYYAPGNMNPKSKRTFGQLHKYTLQKEADLKLAGYTVVSIWESEYLKQKLGKLPRHFQRLANKRILQHL